MSRLPARDDWQDVAACRNYGTQVSPDFELWWHPYNNEEMPAEARAVCRGCPVLHECKVWVMSKEGKAGASTRRLRHGNRAGMTPGERYRLAVYGDGTPVERRGRKAKRGRPPKVEGA